MFFKSSFYTNSSSFAGVLYDVKIMIFFNIKLDMFKDVVSFNVFCYYVNIL